MWSYMATSFVEVILRRWPPGALGRSCDRLDEERRPNGAAAIGRAGLLRIAPPAGDRFDQAGGEPGPGLVESDVAPAVRRRLRQLAQHHQLWERRDAAGPPELAASAQRLGQRRRKMEREAFVAGHVVVRTEIFVAGMPDQ